MSLLDRVRAHLADASQMREIEMLGGVVFEWDGDPLVGVVDDELIVRVEGGGWAPATTGDLSELVERSAEIVIAECVVRWHAELRAGDPAEASRAVLALVRHDPEREQLQRLLLDLTRHPQLGRLAVTCLGHVARYDGSVLPEVVPHLQKLGVCAEDALEDIEIFTNPFRLWRHSTPWVIFAPPGDGEVARQLPLADAAGAVVVVVPHAEALPSLRQFVRDACEDVVNRTHSFDGEDWWTDDGKAPVHYVLEYDGDIAALEPLFEDEETSARFKAPYLHVW